MARAGRKPSFERREFDQTAPGSPGEKAFPRPVWGLNYWCSQKPPPISTRGQLQNRTPPEPAPVFPEGTRGPEHSVRMKSECEEENSEAFSSRSFLSGFAPLRPLCVRDLPLPSPQIRSGLLCLKVQSSKKFANACCNSPAKSNPCPARRCHRRSSSRSSWTSSSRRWEPTPGPSGCWKRPAAGT